jgi:SAM-dependent methyltransferase
MKTYIRRQRNLTAAFKEYVLLYKSLKRLSADADRQAQRVVEDYEKLATLIGRDLAECDLLEVGVGQMPLRLVYLTAKTRSAVGLDLDVIAVRYSPAEFIKMTKCNGLTRTLRTFGRRWLNLDNNLVRAFCARMGLSRFPDLSIVQGDICAGTQLQASSFDVIVSTNVFEHLANPVQAVAEMSRLLRPRGVLLVSTCHWGQSNAIHDLEVMYGRKPARWAHLRPSLKHEVKQHAYVNDLRIKDWEALFSRHFDETTVVGVPPPDTSAVRRELELARGLGELEGFSDEELLCESCIVRCFGRGEPVDVK